MRSLKRIVWMETLALSSGRNADNDVRLVEFEDSFVRACFRRAGACDYADLSAVQT